MNRRAFVAQAAGIPAAFLLNSQPEADHKLFVTDFAIHEVKVNARGNWHFVELKTNKGLTGLGEASHGFAVKDGPAQLHAEIRRIFEFVKNQSPFNISQFRQRGLAESAEISPLRRITRAARFPQQPAYRFARQSLTFLFLNMHLAKYPGVPSCFLRLSILTKVISTFPTLPD
jgi:hypothetical protein